MLAKALLDCHKNAQAAEGTGLGLRVFIAGRNRLENEGATALAGVFKVCYFYHLRPKEMSALSHYFLPSYIHC